MTEAAMIIGAFLAGMGFVIALFGLLVLSSAIRVDVDGCGNAGGEE